MRVAIMSGLSLVGQLYSTEDADSANAEFDFMLKIQELI
jgi:hypothetical protein